MVHKFLRKIAVWWFQRKGWSYTGELPGYEPKTIIIANRSSGKRDFWLAIAVLTLTHFRCTMLVDKKKFHLLYTRILKGLSCRPYDFDRTEEEFLRLRSIYEGRKKQSMVFTTRKASEASDVFREDFYRMAEELHLPIIMVSFDKVKKMVRIHSAFLASDRERDIDFCKKFLK